MRHPSLDFDRMGSSVGWAKAPATIPTANTRSSAAPCPRVGREGEPGRKRVGTARVRTTDVGARSWIARLCPPYAAAVHRSDFIETSKRGLTAVVSALEQPDVELGHLQHRF